MLPTLFHYYQWLLLPIPTPISSFKPPILNIE